MFFGWILIRLGLGQDLGLDLVLGLGLGFGQCLGLGLSFRLILGLGLDLGLGFELVNRWRLPRSNTFMEENR